MLVGELTGHVKPMWVYCDNTAALVMMPQSTAGVSGKKHVEVAYQFVLDRVMRGDIDSAPRLAECCRMIGMSEM
jgi:hypothetical protein